MAIEKTGIKYYSQDVDNVRNPKIKMLFLNFDSHGPWIWECLKCEIYERKGYYFDLRKKDELALFASDVCKKPVSLVMEVIKECVKRELFNQHVFNAFDVLTSERIQQNYLDGTRDRRNKGYEATIISEYWFAKIKQNEKGLRVIDLKGDVSSEITVFSMEKPPKEEEIRIDKRRERGFSPPLSADVSVFFKEKSGWNEKKCEKEAEKFINHYGKTNWLIRGDPIVNWENAASGWIEKDVVYGNKTSDDGKKTDVAHIDYWDEDYHKSLKTNECASYFKHLRLLGYEPRFGDQGKKLIGYFKP